MASLIDAGLPITKALRQRSHGTFSRIGQVLADRIEQGDGRLYELMADYPQIFSDFEHRIVKVGEETGRLENSFKVLADYYQERSAMISNLWAGLGYPIFVFHFAAVLIPFISFILGSCSLTGMIIRIILAFGIPYSLLIGFLLFRWFEKHNRIQPPIALSRLWISFPLFGKVTRKYNYAQFFHSYSIAIQSGLGAAEAVILGAEACGNAWVRDSFLRTAEGIKNSSCPFSEALINNIYPADRDSICIQIMESGEMAGRSVESAAKIAEISRNESVAAMKLIVSIVPKVVYLCLAFYIGWKVITFWGNILSQVNSLAQ